AQDDAALPGRRARAAALHVLVSRLPSAQRRVHAVRSAWPAMLAIVLALACGLPDLEPRQAAPPPGPPPDPAAFAGPEACAACHADYAESYDKSAHPPPLGAPARPPHQRGSQ